MDFNFTQPHGLVMIGLPDKTLALVEALSQKTGSDIATVIGTALQMMAYQVLNEAEKKALIERMN